MRKLISDAVLLSVLRTELGTIIIYKSKQGTVVQSPLVMPQQRCSASQLVLRETLDEEGLGNNASSLSSAV
jgi:hypothetical protein